MLVWYKQLALRTSCRVHHERLYRFLGHICAFVTVEPKELGLGVVQESGWHLSFIHIRQIRQVEYEEEPWHVLICQVEPRYHLPKHAVAFPQNDVYES